MALQIEESDFNDFSQEIELASWSHPKCKITLTATVFFVPSFGCLYKVVHNQTMVYTGIDLSNAVKHFNRETARYDMQEA